MKILANISENYGGVEYHRLRVPFNHMANENCIIHSSPTIIPKKETKVFQDYDLVVVSRCIDVTGAQGRAIKNIKKYSKLVVDIDDLWILYKQHFLYKQYKKLNYKHYTKELLQAADLVTTTTKYLADEISKVTDSPVAILPNAINPDLSQWGFHRELSDSVRFGWVGGIHHVPDIASVREDFKDIASLSNEIYMAGYSEDEPAYKYYASVLSGQGKKQIQRIGAAHVEKYAHAYDYFDVALAPLEDNRFNNCKSELKIIEAGFKKCAVIASDVRPYDLVKNIIRCKPGEWYKTFKRLADNPNEVEDLQEALYEEVQRYHIKEVNKARVEAYNSIL